MSSARIVRPAVVLIAVLALVACEGDVSSTATSPGGKSAASVLEVCADGCAFDELAAALAAAHEGDTVHLAAGTYDGGVSITTDITLRGDGADGTEITGGGPVVTVGEFDAASQPTVTIEGLAITGGRTETSVEADQAGLPGAEAIGGGIYVPPGLDGTPGATLTLRDVLVSGNQAASTDFEVFDDGIIELASSLSSGGGIDNWGDLTLEGTTVSGNKVGAATDLSKPGNASDAYGGGIAHHQGDLTIVDSEISDNVTGASSPNGRYAEGGGLFILAGTFTMRDSVVSGNRAELESAFPLTVEAQAASGGILLGSEVTEATIEGSEIVGNAAVMTSSGEGLADATAGGINVIPGVDLTFGSSTIAGNRVEATATGQGDAMAAIGGGALLGTVTDTVFEGNEVVSSSQRGDASSAVGGVVLPGTLDGATVVGNRLEATASMGEVIVFGAGVWVAEEPLVVRDSVIRNNVGRATGDDGWVRGGGIYAGPNPGGFGPSPLTMFDTEVAGNHLVGGWGLIGLDPEGGGLYVDGVKLKLRRTTITGNGPDECVGCH